MKSSKSDIKIGLLKFEKANLSFDNYNAEKYKNHINSFGLETTWAHLLNYLMNNPANDFLKISNFGEMYEEGLAIVDKNDKKKSGQYFTPKDVSDLMATWFKELGGENICDVGCGTGNLILSFLEQLNRDQVLNLLENKKIYLYDLDPVALTIAQYSIALEYGIGFLNNINIVNGDFLSDNIYLPDNSKIISNPPYGRLSNTDIFSSQIAKETKELYAAFMEKIILSGNRSVIITPFSFLGGKKFQTLRMLMNDYNGFIASFDNVPGNIFNGRKHGIFNTNTANSVRAAITVIENKPEINGFRTTPLIRFKNNERELLLKDKNIDGLISNNYQIITSEFNMYEKNFIQLEDCFNKWKSESTQTMKDLLVQNGKYTIYMPNTCRYFTVGSFRKLDRRGYITLSFNSKEEFNFVYALINSSFVYWWWRIYAGAFTYPKGLLYSVPIFLEKLTDLDKIFFEKIVSEMIEKENEYITTKLNAGKKQENIKFDEYYRNKLNERFLKILNCSNNYSDFVDVHSNHFNKED